MAEDAYRAGVQSQGKTFRSGKCKPEIGRLTRAGACLAAVHA